MVDGAADLFLRDIFEVQEALEKPSISERKVTEPMDIGSGGSSSQGEPPRPPASPPGGASTQHDRRLDSKS